MRAAERTHLELREFETVALPREALDDTAALLIDEHHRDKVTVEWPTPKTGHKWLLTAQGFVGTLVLDAERGVRIAPKVPVQNLFRMLEYAYRVDVRFPQGATKADALEDFYSRLAEALATRILQRVHKGLYRTYVGAQDRLPYLRGRVDMRAASMAPWEVLLPCQYEEHTPDVDENRILAFTLHTVGRNVACSQKARLLVGKAYQALRGHVTVVPFSGADCKDRNYNRLVEDYEPLHALCRFFLSNCGPTHVAGQFSMLPFLIRMDYLFQEFVVEWLRRNLPPGVRITGQKRLDVGGSCGLQFYPDIVMSNARTGEALVVLDTKYKQEGPAHSDFHQINSYLQMMQCRNGVLIYPRRQVNPLDVNSHGARIRTLGFDLSGDLEQAGREFLSVMLEAIQPLG